MAKKSPKKRGPGRPRVAKKKKLPTITIRVDEQTSAWIEKLMKTCPPTVLNPLSMMVRMAICEGARHLCPADPATAATPTFLPGFVATQSKERE